MDLDVSLSSLTATARLTIATEHAEVALEAAGLVVTAVRDGDGAAQSFHHDGWSLTVPVAPGVSQVEIDYVFAKRGSDGWLTTGTTLTWPYHCGNLFPCLSSPTEGIAFTLAVSDAPAGEALVYPIAVTAEVPAYVVAWASGAYAELKLGTTPRGTALSVWHLPGKAGSVEGNWGIGAYGGMEHHPIGTWPRPRWTTTPSTFTKRRTAGSATRSAWPAGRISCSARAPSAI